MADPKSETAERNSRRHIDPLLQGLLQRLPKRGETWPEHTRKEWMATLEANLKLIYPVSEQGGPMPAGAPRAQPTPGTVRSA